MSIERKTSSMLQRVPVILAVTAASYGLQLPPHIAARNGGTGLAQATVPSQPNPGNALAQLPARPPVRG